MASELNDSIAVEKSSSSSTKNSLVSFTNTLSVKLDNNNFLLWQRQALAAIRGYNLQHFVFESTSKPTKFLYERSKEVGNVNPEFLLWKQQDQLLTSWLFSSMSNSVLARVVSCETSAQVWKTLETYFAAQIRAKVSQYKTQLSQTRKENVSMIDYLLKIRHLVDMLNLVGHDMDAKTHITAIYDGLPEDYDMFTLHMDLSSESLSVEEVESLLHSVEARIEKRQNRLEGSISANMANTINHSDKRKSNSFPEQSHNSGGYSPRVRGYSQRGGYGGRGRGRSGRGNWNPGNKP